MMKFPFITDTIMEVARTKIGFKQSRTSPNLYFQWRRNRSASCIEAVRGLMDLKGKKVLDLGCGYGALSSLLLEQGAHVRATEMDKNKLSFAKQKLAKYSRFRPRQVKDSTLPYPDKQFDAIFIFDVIEHVDDPAKTLKECLRTLKKEGLLYVEFTPYYSITGHHLYDYAKWPIHMLPEDKIRDIVFSKKVKGFMTQEYYWRQYKSLNKLRIGEFQDMVKKFETIREKFIIKYPEVFEWNLPFINYLGPFKDYFTMSFEGLYRKK